MEQIFWANSDCVYTAAEMPPRVVKRHGAPNSSALASPEVRAIPAFSGTAEKQIKAFVHGDGHESTGTVEAVSWLSAELEKAHEIKTQKLGGAEGYKVEGKVLNRVIRRKQIPVTQNLS